MLIIGVKKMAKNKGTDERLTLPSDWSGQKYFTREQWATLKLWLKQHPDAMLIDAIAHFQKPPF